MMDEHKAECQGCGLEPNVRSGDAVIWCDECYSELRDRLARMQPVVDAVANYVIECDDDAARWWDVLEALSEYKEAE